MTMSFKGHSRVISKWPNDLVILSLDFSLVRLDFFIGSEPITIISYHHHQKMAVGKFFSGSRIPLISRRVTPDAFHLYRLFWELRIFLVVKYYLAHPLYISWALIRISYSKNTTKKFSVT